MTEATTVFFIVLSTTLSILPCILVSLCQRRYVSYIKPIVFGGLDGVCTAVACLVGAIAIGVPGSQVETMTCAQILAGTISTVVGAFIAESSRRAVLKQESARKIRTVPDGNRAEMMHIYLQHGVSLEDATEMVTLLSRYPDVWMKHVMLQHEFGLIPEDSETSSPLREACVMGASFASFSVIGLLAFAVARALDMARGSITLVCACATVASLILLGVLRGRAEDANMAKATSLTVLQGALAAAAALLPSAVAGFDAN